MRKAFILLALLAVAPVQAQMTSDLLGVLLTKPQLPGGQSFRFLAKDLATLKTDIAGTTQVASAGDTVGTWVDGSGNGYTVAAAADNTTRPLYQIRSGKPYVASDGTNDLLYSITAPNLIGSSGANSFTICMAYRWTSPVGGKSVINEADPNAAATILSYIRSLAATPANMTASMRGSDGGTNIVDGTATFISNANDGNDHVLCYVRVGATLTPYLDGVASAGQSVVTTATVASQLNLFGRWRNRNGAGAKDEFAAIDLYGIVAWQNDQTGNLGKINKVLRGLMP